MMDIWHELLLKVLDGRQWLVEIHDRTCGICIDIEPFKSMMNTVHELLVSKSLPVEAIVIYSKW